MPFGMEGGPKRKQKGWAGVAAQARTRKAKAVASRPARDASKRARVNLPMNSMQYTGPQVFPEFK